MNSSFVLIVISRIGQDIAHSSYVSVQLLPRELTYVVLLLTIGPCMIEYSRSLRSSGFHATLYTYSEFKNALHKPEVSFPCVENKNNVYQHWSDNA
jgi:hypothetical protein